jgi:hypothetical protein
MRGAPGHRSMLPFRGLGVFGTIMHGGSWSAPATLIAGTRSKMGSTTRSWRPRVAVAAGAAGHPARTGEGWQGIMTTRAVRARPVAGSVSEAYCAGAAIRHCTIWATIQYGWSGVPTICATGRHEN